MTGAPHAKPIVFLGPSLPVPQARQILQADYRPPAGQGDIFRACAHRPPAIALIDGIFKDAPTVRHREILWAMSQGIPVYGAASMGALRAAELWAHGMIGMGLIYRWYRRYPLLPDDAVAVTHTPRELGAQALSPALVDIRRSLAAAKRKGHLAPAQVADLTQDQAARPFAQRVLPNEAAQSRVDQKARDAQTLLRHMSHCQAHQNWPVPSTPQPAIVHAWLDDLRASGLSLPDQDPDQGQDNIGLSC